MASYRKSSNENKTMNNENNNASRSSSKARNSDIPKQHSSLDNPGLNDKTSELNAFENHALCLCGGSNTSPTMVACDGCDRWFHLDCIGIPTDTTPSALLDMTVFCPHCHKKKKRKMKKKLARPTESHQRRRYESQTEVSGLSRQVQQNVGDTDVSTTDKSPLALDKPPYRSSSTKALPQTRADVVQSSGSSTPHEDSDLQTVTKQKSPSMLQLQPYSNNRARRTQKIDEHTHQHGGAHEGVATEKPNSSSDQSNYTRQSVITQDAHDSGVSPKSDDGVEAIQKLNDGAERNHCSPDAPTCRHDSAHESMAMEKLDGSANRSSHSRQSAVTLGASNPNVLLNGHRRKSKNSPDKPQGTHVMRDAPALGRTRESKKSTANAVQLDDSCSTAVHEHREYQNSQSAYPGTHECNGLDSVISQQPEGVELGSPSKYSAGGDHHCIYSRRAPLASNGTFLSTHPIRSDYNSIHPQYARTFTQNPTIFDCNYFYSTYIQPAARMRHETQHHYIDYELNRQSYQTHEYVANSHLSRSLHQDAQMHKNGTSSSTVRGIDVYPTQSDFDKYQQPRQGYHPSTQQSKIGGETPEYDVPPLICVPLPLGTSGNPNMAINSPPGALRSTEVREQLFNQCIYHVQGSRCTNRTEGQYCYWHCPEDKSQKLGDQTAYLQLESQLFVQKYSQQYLRL